MVLANLLLNWEMETAKIPSIALRSIMITEIVPSVDPMKFQIASVFALQLTFTEIFSVTPD
jgi:hypothetical protein